MTDYHGIISKLLNDYILTPDSQVYCLSIYFPYGENPDRTGNLREQFRAFVQDELKKFEPLQEYKFFRTNIANRLLEISANFDYNEEGFAAFCKFEIDKQAKGNWEYDNQEVVWANLHRCQALECTIGKHPDLDQLIANYNDDSIALILDLSRFDCNFYTLRQHILTHLETVQNTHLDQDEVYNSPRTNKNPGEGWWNTNEDFNWIVEEDKHFLNDLEKRIDQLHQQHKFDYLIVFHSANFSHIKQQLTTKLDNYKFDGKATFIELNLNQPNDIKAESIKILEHLRKEQTQNLLKKSQENYQHFIGGWQHICDASREGRIQILFLKPKLHQPGFVIDGDLVFLSPQDDAQEVSDINPWLVKSVITHGGQVMVLDEEVIENQVEISAKTRF